MGYNKEVILITIICLIYFNQFLSKDNNHYLIMVKKIKQVKEEFKELIPKNIKEKLFLHKKIL